MVQTAEGALSEVHSMLQRVRDLKVQFQNGTLDQNDQDAIASEVGQISQEVANITTDTKFNGKTVFNTDFTFQVGANDGETISIAATGISGGFAAGGLSELTTLSSGSTGTVSAALAAMAISDIDAAITNVSKVRSTYGAVQNRLEHRLNNLATYQENLTASESRIRDVDMASEMTKFTKLNILQQAGTSMLAQANQSGQGVLSLLR
jgi:flagellin